MEYLLFLQNIRESSPAFINYFFLFISEILVAGVILIPSLVYWCSDKRTGLWMLLNYSGAYMINQIIKNTACVYRPWIKDSRLRIAPQAAKSATGYSFPSGHTVLAASTLESLAVWQRKRKWIAVFSSMFILLVAFARNWLGAHTQYDVITAILETSLVIIVNIFIVRFLENLSDRDVKKNNFDVFVLCIGLFLVTAVMLYLQFKKYPIDYNADGSIVVNPYEMLTDCYTGAGLISGLLLGWFLERRMVHFTYEVSKKNLLLRGVLGAILLALMYAVILPMMVSFMGEHLKHFVKYFLLMIFITLIYPAAFTLIGRIKKQN